MIKALQVLTVCGLIAVVLYAADGAKRIFGYWPAIVFVSLNILIEWVLAAAIGRKTKIQDGWMFNPKELPKLLSIAVIALTGYYVFTQLNNPSLSDHERNSGWLLVVLYVSWAVVLVYRVIRDKDDFVKISGSILSYSDNQDSGELSLDRVKSVATALGDVHLVLLDGNTRVINTSAMNFRSGDLSELIKVINERLPKPKADGSPDAAARTDETATAPDVHTDTGHLPSQ